MKLTNVPGLHYSQCIDGKQIFTQKKTPENIVYTSGANINELNTSMSRQKRRRRCHRLENDRARTRAHTYVIWLLLCAQVRRIIGLGATKVNERSHSSSSTYTQCGISEKKIKAKPKKICLLFMEVQCLCVYMLTMTDTT